MREGTVFEGRSFGRLMAVVIVLAFALNLAWEYGQCSAFFVHGALRATPRSMLVAAIGDVALTVSLYLATAAATRSLNWPLGAWHPLTWVTIEVLAVGEGLGMEWIGLSMGRWSYTPRAPMIPWTSLSIIPVAQLPLLAPLVFWVARRAVLRLRP